MARRGWPPSLLLVLLLASAPAACSGAPTTDTLNAAVQASRDAGVLGVRMEGAASVRGGTPLGSFTADGRADLGDGAREVRVSVDLAEADAYEADVVAVEDATYVRGLPGLIDRGFVMIDGAPRAVSADLPAFVDPLAVVELLEGLTGSVTDLGEEALEGVATTRLRVVLPPARMARQITTILDSLGGGMREAVEEAGELRAAATAEVWLDDEQLVRQLELRTRADVGGTQAVPGVGAIDNVLLLGFTPLPDGEAVQPPEETAGRVPFAALVAAQAEGRPPPADAGD